MKTGAELPAILTIHHLDDGEYLVRITDLAYRPLVVAVSKLLTDARQLVLITPADVKVLRVSGRDTGDGAVASRPRVNAQEGADADPEILQGEVSMESLDAETQAAIREQESHSVPGEPQPAEAPVPEAGMRVVRRAKPNGRAGHEETCGRCRGDGTIRIIDETGGAGQAPCGVCQGSGVVIRYGAKR